MCVDFDKIRHPRALSGGVGDSPDGVCHGRCELGLDGAGGVGEKDPGLGVGGGFGHFGGGVAEGHDSLCGGCGGLVRVSLEVGPWGEGEGHTEDCLGNGEDWAIVVVEGGGEVAGEFDMLELVFTDRDMCCACGGTWSASLLPSM